MNPFFIQDFSDLMCACQQGDVETAQIILDAGADPNRQNSVRGRIHNPMAIQMQGHILVYIVCRKVGLH